MGELGEAVADGGHLAGAEHYLVAVEGFGAGERGGRGAGDDEVFDFNEGFFQFFAEVVGGQADFFFVAAF